MNGVMAPADGRHDHVPLPFHVAAEGVERGLEPRLVQHALAGRDVLGQRHTDPERDNRNLGKDSHTAERTTRGSGRGQVAGLAGVD